MMMVGDDIMKSKKGWRSKSRLEMHKIILQKVLILSQYTVSTMAPVAKMFGASYIHKFCVIWKHVVVLEPIRAINFNSRFIDGTLQYSSIFLSTLLALCVTLFWMINLSQTSCSIFDLSGQLILSPTLKPSSFIF